MTTPGLVLVHVADGKKNLFTYAGTRPRDGSRTWQIYVPHSHTENRIYQETLPAHLQSFGPLAGRISGLHLEDVGQPARPASQRRVSREPPVRDGVVHLAAGIDVALATLFFIFDALASTASTVESKTIDLKQLKDVVSQPQLGGRIHGLGGLTEDQRKLAVPALYAAIVKRCANV